MVALRLNKSSDLFLASDYFCYFCVDQKNNQKNL